MDTGVASRVRRFTAIRVVRCSSSRSGDAPGRCVANEMRHALWNASAKERLEWRSTTFRMTRGQHSWTGRVGRRHEPTDRQTARGSRSRRESGKVCSSQVRRSFFTGRRARRRSTRSPCGKPSRPPVTRWARSSDPRLIDLVADAGEDLNAYYDGESVTFFHFQTGQKPPSRAPAPTLWRKKAGVRLALNG